MAVGLKNVIDEPLVDRDRIIFPPLHIKLSLMEKYFKSFDIVFIQTKQNCRHLE